MILKIKKINEQAIIPKYKTSGSVGMDLNSIENIELAPQEIKLIGTGLSIELEQKFEAQIRPRSGLSLKGITVINSPGTIDSDYRGEIKIILINLSKQNFTIHKGDRIAQMIIQKVEIAELEEVSELSDTKRGKKGFGSTGLK